MPDCAPRKPPPRFKLACVAYWCGAEQQVARPGPIREALGGEGTPKRKALRHETALGHKRSGHLQEGILHESRGRPRAQEHEISSGCGASQDQLSGVSLRITGTGVEPAPDGSVILIAMGAGLVAGLSCITAQRSTVSMQRYGACILYHLCNQGGNDHQPLAVPA